jgi:hypothetical protein
MAFMEQMRCANLSCIKSEQHRGGRYRFIGGKWYCQECAEWAGTGAVMNPGKNLWDFTTTHFNGHPVRVKSLQHLRTLEKQFGVSNHAANFDTRHW